MQVWHEDIMDEPFYESIGPDYIEVRKDVKKRFYNPNGLCIVSVQPKYISLVDKIIEEIIPENRNDFGSYRGYATFTRRTLIEGLLEKLETRKLEIAYRILCNSRIMIVLMNSVIYKPGTKRVKQVENNFNELKNKKK